jgi:hypothetical protein
MWGLKLHTPVTATAVFSQSMTARCDQEMFGYILL